MATSGVAYQMVAEALRQEILTGRLRVGDRLPSEGELGERFKVSRSTVREALRMLSSQRMISTTRGQGGGTTVAPIGATDVTEMLIDGIHLLAMGDHANVHEL